MKYDLIVIGGGAAGFFGAIEAAAMNSDLKILILEKSTKLLSKVKVSGGGRCNVTHNCFDPAKLSRHYPRGEKFLRNLFKRFNAEDTVLWFEARGVKLKTEDDGRMFPVTDNSQTIIDCFMREALRFKIKIEMGEGVTHLEKNDKTFLIKTQTGKTFTASKVLFTIGGHPNLEMYKTLAGLGLTINSPIPSLFTFNDADKRFNELMGVSMPDAEIRIAGSKFSSQGPVLITHWGLSGPATIRLSAWAAEYLYQQRYEFIALVNWIGKVSEEEIRNFFIEHKKTKGKQKVVSNPLFQIPQRLWTKFCELSEIDQNKIWAELPQKNINRMIEFIIRCPFTIKGKTTFKDEFVTCGGVDLKEIKPETMESKSVPGLYFAGEVLNIDGETGGFNFQAAWSTAHVAASSLTA